MTKAPRFTQSELVSLLKSEGFTEAPNRGRHGIKLVKEGVRRPIIVPNCKGRTLPVGLSNDILEQANVAL